jgi:hypothetical protein
VGLLRLHALRGVGDINKEPSRDQKPKAEKHLIIARGLALISGILLYFGILAYLSNTTPGSAIETLLQSPLTAPPQAESEAPPQTEAATAPPQTDAATAPSQTGAATAPPQTEAATAPPQTDAATAPSQTGAATAPPRTAPTALRRTAPSMADQLNREELLRIDHRAYRGAPRGIIRGCTIWCRHSDRRIFPLGARALRKSKAPPRAAPREGSDRGHHCGI